MAFLIEYFKFQDPIEKLWSSFARNNPPNRHDILKEGQEAQNFHPRVTSCLTVGISVCINAQRRQTTRTCSAAFGHLVERQNQIKRMQYSNTAHQAPREVFFLSSRQSGAECEALLLVRGHEVQDRNKDALTLVPPFLEGGTPAVFLLAKLRVRVVSTTVDLRKSTKDASWDNIYTLQLINIQNSGTYLVSLTFSEVLHETLQYR